MCIIHKKKLQYFFKTIISAIKNTMACTLLIDNINLKYLGVCYVHSLTIFYKSANIWAILREFSPSIKNSNSLIFKKCENTFKTCNNITD